jgi:hypothetical protein
VGCHFEIEEILVYNFYSLVFSVRKLKPMRDPNGSPRFLGKRFVDSWPFILVSVISAAFDALDDVSIICAAFDCT